MNELTRRRDRNPSKEIWRIYYAAVRVGTIGERSGAPNHADRWEWSCGFQGLDIQAHSHGTAANFDGARSAFEQAWRQMRPRCTEEAFRKEHYQQAFTAWKYAMWDAGCKMPTQTVDGRTKCFCGVPIDNMSNHDHIIRCHMDLVAA